MKALTPAGVGEWAIFAAAVLAALGVIWRQAVRPAWRAWRKALGKMRRIHDLIERELTHNGGSSIKDAAARTTRQLEDVQASTRAIVAVLDGIVERKEYEHDEIWQALEQLGMGRRRGDG